MVMGYGDREKVNQFMNVILTLENSSNACNRTVLLVPVTCKMPRDRATQQKLHQIQCVDLHLYHNLMITIRLSWL